MFVGEDRPQRPRKLETKAFEVPGSGQFHHGATLDLLKPLQRMVGEDTGRACRMLNLPPPL
eukprot:12243128-Alexandrium_andersonii.AAC.1